MNFKAFNKLDIILFKKSIKYIKPYKVKISLAFLCIILGIILSVIQPLIWGKILASLFGKNFPEVLKQTVFVSIVFILQIVTSSSQTYILGVLSNNIVYDIKRDMYKQILDLPIKAFDDMSSGEFISRLNSDTSIVANMITEQFLNTIVDILKVLVIGIMVFRINIFLALIVVICFPISYFIFLKYGKILKAKNREFLHENDNYYSHIQQSLSGIKEIRRLGIKSTKLESFLVQACKLKNKSISLISTNCFSYGLSQGINILSELLVIVVGGYLIFTNLLSIEYFVAFSSYSNQFSTSLMNITKLNANIQQTLASIERIFNLMDNLSYPVQIFGNKTVKNINGNIKFKNVCFGYNDSNLVLENISFTVPQNSKIALVGSSGGGKTTILNLLLRFYEPDKGKITIDNINIKDFTEESLREHIAVVPQEPYLFNVSIKENLLFANTFASDIEIEEVCKAAYIHDHIMSLPEKYDSIIGENGVNFSGGQKQRIAIARALLKKSKIIIFDEATSFLDNMSQEYIKGTINSISKDHTVIIIAHRLSTIIEADKIIVIENGRISSVGNHKSLMNENCMYKSLFEKEIFNSDVKVVGTH